MAREAGANSGSCEYIGSVCWRRGRPAGVHPGERRGRCASGRFPAWQRGIDVPQFAAAYADLSLEQKGELEAQVAQLEADLAEIRKVLGESEG